MKTDTGGTVFWRNGGKRRQVSYPSFEVALGACEINYSSDLIAETVARKTAVAIDSDEYCLSAGAGEHVFLGVLYASRLSGAPTRVLDFGGAAGLHAALSIDTLPDIEQRWAIVETQPMVNAARKLERSNMRFFDSTVAAAQWLGPVDLIHTSGAIECTPDPELAIDEITDVGARCILVQRTFLSEGDKITFVSEAPLSSHGPVRGQGSNGGRDPLVRTPVTGLRIERFRGRFEAAGYDLVTQFKGHNAFKVGKTRIRHGTTFLFLRRPPEESRARAPALF